MAGMKGKNTLPEVLVRRYLSAAGVRYRLRCRDLTVAPDIVLPGPQACILVHGCFWHVHKGCRLAPSPETRLEFWKAKLQGNVERDEAATAKLAMLRWRVLVVWECSTRNGAAAGLANSLIAWINGNSEYGEIGALSRGARPLAGGDTP